MLQSGDNSITQHGSSLEVGGNLTLSAERDLAVIASQVKAGGDIDMVAGSDLIIASAADEQHQYSYRKQGKTKTTQQADNVVQRSSEISAGGDLAMQAGNDLVLAASRLEAEGDAYLYAGGELALLAAQNSEYSLYDMQKKGSWGSKKTQRDEVTTVRNVGSSITTGGNLSLISEGDQLYQKARLESGNDSQEDQFCIGAAPSTRAHLGPRATPAVRQMARQLGVDLTGLHGSGAAGQLTAADVEAAARQAEDKFGGEKLRGVRRSMAINMARAHAEVVPVVIVGDADLHLWAEARDPLVRLAQAIAAACRVEPLLNSWFDGKNLSLKQHEQLDLGIAVDSPDGLFVPVLRNVGARSAEDLKAGAARLRADVKARSIPPQEMMGATLTLSNFGTLFGRYANPIVMPPQVAIIGAGGIRDEPVAVKGKVEVHPILPLSLTFDHRAVTGGEAARFLKALVQALEQREG